MIDYLILSWFKIFLQPTITAIFLKRLLQNTYWSVFNKPSFYFPEHTVKRFSNMTNLFLYNCTYKCFQYVNIWLLCSQFFRANFHIIRHLHMLQTVCHYAPISEYNICISSSFVWRLKKRNEFLNCKTFCNLIWLLYQLNVI